MSDSEEKTPESDGDKAGNQNESPLPLDKIDRFGAIDLSAAERIREAMEPIHRIRDQIPTIDTSALRGFEQVGSEMEKFNKVARRVGEFGQGPLAETFGACARLQGSENLRATLSSLQQDQERLSEISNSAPYRTPAIDPPILESPMRETNRHLQTVAEVGQNQLEHLQNLEQALAEDRKARERKAEEDRKVQQQGTRMQWLTVALISAGLIVQVLVWFSGP